MGCREREREGSKVVASSSNGRVLGWGSRKDTIHLARGVLAHLTFLLPQSPDVWPETSGPVASNTGKPQRTLECTKFPPAR